MKYTAPQRLDIMLRLEALIGKVRLQSIVNYEDNMLKLLNLMIAEYLKTEGLTDLQRRRAIEKVIKANTNKTYDELEPEVLDDMVNMADFYTDVMEDIYDTPTDKVYKYNNKTLLHNYELGDLIGSNNVDNIKKFKAIIAEAVTEGKGYKDVARELKNGVDRSMAHVSDVVIQAAMDKARADAMLDSYKYLLEEGFAIAFEWVATLEVNTCVICRDLDGQSWKTIEEIPPVPAHFRCRCTVVPLTEYEDESVRAGYQYDAQGNPIPSSFGNINYKEWLKLQPKVVQDAINSHRYLSLEDLQRIVLWDITDYISFAEGIRSSIGTEEAAKKIIERLINMASEGAKRVINMLPKPGIIRLKEKGGSYGQDKIITTDKLITLVHEYGHFIDNRLGDINKYYSEFESLDAVHPLVKAYMEEMKNYGIPLSLDGHNIGSDFNEEAFHKIITKINDIKFDGISIYRQISDTYDALYKGVVYEKADMPGHGIDYFDNEKRIKREIFAQSFTAYAVGGKDWELYKELFPNITKTFEQIMEDVANGKSITK